MRAQAAKHIVINCGRPQLDLLRPDSVSVCLDEVRPDIVINAAAYTAVDAAEDNEAEAFAVNGAGAGNLAVEAAGRNLPIIHLSTDYVFDGAKAEAYDEANSVAPLGAYGRSKLEGERQVAAGNPQHLILRTAWVYSPFGKNFVKTMLQLAENRDEVSVVADQVGSPTYALHIADALLAMCDAIDTGDGAGPWGLYNLAGSGTASWAELAEEIFSLSQAVGGPAARVNHITTEAFPTPARRPANSRLNCARLEAEWNILLPDWHQGVADCLAHLTQHTEKVD